MGVNTTVSRARAVATAPSAAPRAKSPGLTGTTRPISSGTTGAVGKPKPVLNPSVAVPSVQSSVRERGGGDSAAEEDRERAGVAVRSTGVLGLRETGGDEVVAASGRTRTRTRTHTAEGMGTGTGTPPKAFAAGVQRFLEVKRVAMDRWSLAARPTTEGAAAERSEQPLLGLGRPRDLWAPTIERFHEAPATELSIPKVRVSVCETSRQAHLRVLPCGLPACKTPGGLTNGSEVSSRGNRRISAYVRVVVV